MKLQWLGNTLLVSMGAALLVAACGSGDGKRRVTDADAGEAGQAGLGGEPAPLGGAPGVGAGGTGQAGEAGALAGAAGQPLGAGGGGAGAPVSEELFDVTVDASEGGEVTVMGPGCADTTCSVEASSIVTLVATPSPSHTFAAWHGGPGCEGETDNPLELTVTASVECTASFEPVLVNVEVVVEGVGQVVSEGGEIECGNGGTLCAAQLPVGTMLSLSGVPGIGNDFTAWSDACQGSSPSCDIELAVDTTVTAAFAAAPPRTLTVHVTGFLGTVSDLDGLVSCVPGPNATATCQHTYPAHSPVTLQAEPLPSASVAADWQATCPSADGSDCMLVMDADTTVSVAFAGGCVDVLALPEACTLEGNLDCCYRSDASSPYDFDHDGYLDCNTNCGIVIDRCYVGTQFETPCDCDDMNASVKPGAGC